jgi:hypothetical protein
MGETAGGSNMAAIDVKVVQELLIHIDALIRAIRTAGDVGRIRLREIKVDEVRKAVLGNAVELDAAAWSQFPGDEQNELHDRLTMCAIPCKSPLALTAR